MACSQLALTEFLETEEPSSQCYNALSSSQCFNCISYSWPPMIGSPLLICTGCKIIQYCSKLCQSEHWKKVHRYHCKWLSLQTKNIKPNSIHIKEECLSCLSRSPATCHIPVTFPELEPSGNGAVLRVSHDGPTSYWPNGVAFGRLPIELGEMTGKYTCRSEPVISVLQQIVQDMKSEEMFRRRHQQIIKRLEINLRMLRRKLFNSVLQASTVNELEMVTCHDEFGIKIVNDTFEIWLSEPKKTLDGKWGKFVIVLEGFNQLSKQYCFLRLNNLSAEVFKKAGELQTKEEAQLLNPNHWLENFMRTLGKNDINATYQELLKIVCGGKLGMERGQCVAKCKRKFIVSTLVPTNMIINTDLDIMLSNLMEKGNGCVFTESSKDPFFCCGEIICLQAAFERRREEGHVSNLKLFCIATRFMDSECNYCFLFSDQIHRCKNCLTKVYCSQECQNEDWVIHKSFCNELVGDKRREKSEKDARDTSGRGLLMRTVEQMKQLHPDVSDVD